MKRRSVVASAVPVNPTAALAALRRPASAPCWARLALGKIAGATDDTMDTEEINAIGTLLADLSQRTQQLRGYL